jgi:hypothetical protein
LGWGIPIVALLTLLAAAPYKDRRVIYSKGPVASAHAFIAEKCEFCHGEGENNTKPVGFFKQLMRAPTDEACLACHEAPVHHQGNQPPAPACASCHVEHQGHDALFRLSHVQDRACVNCHKDLDEAVRKANVQLVVDVHPAGARYIHKFNGTEPGVDGAHPEFKATSERIAIIKKEFVPLNLVFHHAKHVGPMLSVKGKTDPVTLQCSDCHRPIIAKDDDDWNYRLASSSKNQKMPSLGQRLHADAGREIMSMPTYENNCADCHNLQFDCRFKESVPHPKSFLHSFPNPKIDSNEEDRYREYLKQELGNLHDVVETKYKDKDSKPNCGCSPDCAALSKRFCPAEQPCPGNPSQPRIPEQGDLPSLTPEMRQKNVERAEIVLQQQCKQCHQTDANSPLSREPKLENLPIVKRINLQPRQMPHSIFSHEAHIAFTCGSCHGDLPPVPSCCQDTPVVDRDIPDVKLPLIKSCETCHNGNPDHAGHAENSCFLCHQYHDWNDGASPPRKYPPKYTFQKLRLPPS